MRKALATFAFGPAADLLAVSLPTFQRYAGLHGYDLYVPAEREFSRPWSWFKVPLLLSLIEAGYEAILWIDADVVVRRHDVDILDEAPAAPTGVVVHHTSDGAVPNCGVWVVRSEARGLLEGMWHRTGHRRCDCWWEQAAFIAALGGDPDATPTSTPASDAWGELPYHWNPHVNDARGIPANCRFFHATQIHDRKAAMIQAKTLA